MWRPWRPWRHEIMLLACTLLARLLRPQCLPGVLEHEDMDGDYHAPLCLARIVMMDRSWPVGQDHGSSLVRTWTAAEPGVFRGLHRLSGDYVSHLVSQLFIFSKCLYRQVELKPLTRVLRHRLRGPLVSGSVRICDRGVHPLLKRGEDTHSEWRLTPFACPSWHVGVWVLSSCSPGWHTSCCPGGMVHGPSSCCFQNDPDLRCA